MDDEGDDIVGELVREAESSVVCEFSSDFVVVVGVGVIVVVVSVVLIRLFLRDELFGTVVAKLLSAAFVLLFLILVVVVDVIGKENS
jgi:hypothetical protein